MKIMVFLHGTILMHRHAANKGRNERVAQVVSKEESVKDYAAYIPVGNAVSKLQSWVRQGAELVYLSPHKTIDKVQLDKTILKKNKFPAGKLLYRDNNQSYADIAEAQMPNIIIEDDCESIGGKVQMTYPNIVHETRKKIKSIVVKEFAGIDNLPDTLRELMSYRNEQ